MIASTHDLDCEYSRVLARSIASTRVYDCEYSRVRLQVLASILEFSAREFRLACGQSIARLRSLTLVFGTLVWYCEWYESLSLACKLAAERHCIYRVCNLCTYYIIYLYACNVYVHVYCISSNKSPGAYFLQGLQDPVFKRDRAFILGPVLIFLFLISKVSWTYIYDVSNYGAPTWSLSASSRRPPTTAAMAFICTPKTLPAKRKGCPLSDAPKDNRSTNIIKNSLDKLIAQQTSSRIRLTNWSLDERQVAWRKFCS